MHPAYRDIRTRAGEPAWWCHRGIPRYCDFSPHECTDSGQYVAFLRIACQRCWREMLVASAVYFYGVEPPCDHLLGGYLPRRGDGRDPWKALGVFCYGEPPYHDCPAGEPMNTVPLEVLQFWKRNTGDDWERDSAHEFALPRLKNEGFSEYP